MNVQSKKTPVMRAPDPSDTRALRDAFARFATGVTVVTADSDSGPVAITANSFTSVSLDPPLVLWCLGLDSNRYDAFSDAEHFAIHVLSAEQRDLCDLFAKDGDALAEKSHARNPQNVPVLDNCLARFDCVRRDVYRAGDHAVIVAEVMAVGHQSGQALGFFQGKLGPYPQPV